MYWFAYAADPPAERQRRGLWAQQVDELASPEQELDGAAGAQKESPCSPLGMSVRASPSPPHSRGCLPTPRCALPHWGMLAGSWLATARTVVSKHGKGPVGWGWCQCDRLVGLSRWASTGAVRKSLQARQERECIVVAWERLQVFFILDDQHNAHVLAAQKLFRIQSACSLRPGSSWLKFRWNHLWKFLGVLRRQVLLYFHVSNIFPRWCVLRESKNYWKRILQPLVEIRVFLEQHTKHRSALIKTCQKRCGKTVPWRLVVPDKGDTKSRHPWKQESCSFKFTKHKSAARCELHIHQSLVIVFIAWLMWTTWNFRGRFKHNICGIFQFLRQLRGSWKACKNWLFAFDKREQAFSVCRRVI